MNIYVYSDESGVFDKEHNDYFVFGGLILLSKEENDIAAQNYNHEEQLIRSIRNISPDQELKATFVQNKDKGKLFRSLNNVHKFGVIVHQKKILPQIFISRKTKQRYLDYAYKIALKRKLVQMIKYKIIDPNEVKGLYIYADEHTTATDGIYELRESIEHEFKIGVFNYSYSTYHCPIFPNLQHVNFHLCDSKVKTLIRAADIVANKLYHCAITNTADELKNEKFKIINLP